MMQPLDNLIDQLRKLDTVGVAIAEDALPDIVAANKATAAAGTDAYGTPWPKKKDGGAPLVDVAGKISGVISGSSKAVIVMTVEGYWHRFHQSGIGKWLQQRAILPEDDRGVPPKMVAILRASTSRVLARTFRGAA
jgi:hypothetical protein